jgi:hypothetical protein
MSRGALMEDGKSKELENGANWNERIYFCYVVDKWMSWFSKSVELWGDMGKGIFLLNLV